MKFNFKVGVILNYKADHYDRVKSGEMVELRLDDANPHDKNAVSVFFHFAEIINGKEEPKEELIGYLCGSTETMDGLPKCVKGTVGYRDLLSKLSSAGAGAAACYARLDEEIPYENKAGSKQRRFVASCYPIPKHEAKGAKVEKISVIVAGTAVTCTGLPKVQAKIQEAELKNKTPDVSVCLRGRIPGNSFPVTHGKEQVGMVDEADTAEDAIKMLESWFVSHDTVKGKAKKVIATEVGNKIEVEIAFKEESKDEYFPIIDKAISQGKGQGKELNEKLDVLLKNNVPKELIEAFFEKVILPDNTFKAQEKPTRVFVSKEPVLAGALACILEGLPFRLFGPKGSGKNTLCQTLSWMRNQEEVDFQCNNNTTVYDLIGCTQLENGKTYFQESSFTRGIKEGAFVVLDEFNGVNPGVAEVTHSIFDDRKSVDIPGEGMVKIHPNTFVVFTMNEAGEGYNGTFEMNNATIDRFVGFELKPEESLKEIFPEYDAQKLEQCQRLSDEIRKQVGSSFEETDVTVRGYEHALKLGRWLSMDAALTYAVANKSQNVSSREGIGSLIATIIPPEI